MLYAEPLVITRGPLVHYDQHRMWVDPRQAPIIVHGHSQSDSISKTEGLHNCHVHNSPTDPSILSPVVDDIPEFYSLFSTTDVYGCGKFRHWESHERQIHSHPEPEAVKHSEW